MSAGPLQIDFRAARLDEGAGQALIAAMRAEMATVYDGLNFDSDAMPKAGPRELSPPTGAFIVGRVDETPVCCGGVKRLDDRACEIKRMYVRPEFRGQGVARRLLDALETQARDLGYAVARLDTGPRQPGAQHLYESAGYRPIDNFNANPVASFWGEKEL